MKQYTVQPTDDMVMLNWWNRMLQDGDLFTTFTRSMGAISIFLMSWREPTRLFYETDEAGITMASWTEPLGSLDAGSYGLYVRPDKRHLKSSLQFVLTTIEMGLERFPVLLSTTRDEIMNEQFKKFGFTQTIKLPNIFDEQDAYIGIMTRASFSQENKQRGWVTLVELEGAANGG